MIYYASVFLLYYAWIGFSLRYIQRHRNLFCILGILPLMLLAVLRGDVGTDTAVYVQIVSGIRDMGQAVSGYANTPIAGYGEFTAMVKMLLWFTANPRAILSMIAIFTTVILIRTSLFSERATLLLVTCIVPVFYLDMTMNGVKYGLAFAVATYAILQSYQGNWRVSGILQAIAVFMHTSTLILFFVTWLLINNEKQKKHLLMTVLAVGMVFSLSSYITSAPLPITSAPSSNGGEYWHGKYVVYAQQQSPSLLSGLSTLMLSLATLWLLHYKNSLGRSLTKRQFVSMIGLVALMFIVAKLSYAGLRLQSVVLFAIFVNMQYKPELEELTASRAMKVNLFLIGALGAAFFIKSIISTEGFGASPFLPYKLNPDFLASISHHR